MSKVRGLLLSFGLYTSIILIIICSQFAVCTSDILPISIDIIMLHMKTHMAVSCLCFVMSNDVDCVCQRAMYCKTLVLCRFISNRQGKCLSILHLKYFIYGASLYFDSFSSALSLMVPSSVFR